VLYVQGIELEKEHRVTVVLDEPMVRDAHQKYPLCDCQGGKTMSREKYNYNSRQNQNTVHRYTIDKVGMGVG
jgi:hypothetical protein